jgi:hypothetical protein
MPAHDEIASDGPPSSEPVGDGGAPGRPASPPLSSIPPDFPMFIGKLKSTEGFIIYDDGRVTAYRKDYDGG